MGDTSLRDRPEGVALDEAMLSAPLVPGCVHVWCVLGADIGDPEVLRQGMACLNASERARASKFVRARDRYEFIVGRWMLRHLSAAYCLIDPPDVAFLVAQHGRLELARANRSQIDFNLSHTENLVVCAFTCGGIRIGIDVERIRPSRFDMRIAGDYFSAAACRDILDADEVSRAERFFDYWVLMEACAKAHGTGLLHPPAASFVLENPERSRIRLIPAHASDPAACSFWLVEPVVEYRMAVALVGAPGGPPLVRRLDSAGCHEMICRTVASSGAFRWI